MKKIVLSIILLLAVSMSSIVVAESQGRLVLDCPCSLKTISDSAIEIEFGIQSIAEEIDYQKLELKVRFATYKMRDSGLYVERLMSPTLSPSINSVVERWFRQNWKIGAERF